jgi:hypothetical protein
MYVNEIKSEFVTPEIPLHNLGTYFSFNKKNRESRYDVIVGTHPEKRICLFE